MEIKFLDLKKQYDHIKSEIDAAMIAVINEAAFIGGKYVQAFEMAFAKYQHAQYCIGVGNGTDAIEIALEALDLPPQSEILVPANSFIASAEAVSRSGHRVVFCDCNPQNYTISADDVKKKITARTRAIIPVHLYGHPADMDVLMEIARAHHLKIIEDCAQAHGAEYKGQRVGTFGDLGTFSFYPGKNLGAYGDGGAIITNNEALAHKCRTITNHGGLVKYEHELEGRNSRLDGLQAAILTVKLKYLDRWIETRIHLADYYCEQLQNVAELVLPFRETWARHIYHLFVIRHPNREALRNYLQEHGIQTGIHYPTALPKLKAYAYLHQAEESMFANTTDLELLSLPMGEHLTREDIDYISCVIKNFCTRV